MLDLGTLKIGITTDASKATKELDAVGRKTEQTERETSKSTSKMKSAWGGVKSSIKAAAGAIAIGTAVNQLVDFTKKAVDSAAQFEQLAGGVDKVFGKASEQMKGYAEEAYKTTGMSKNEYLENSMQISAAMTKSLNGDVQKSAEQTDKVMRMIADNSSVYGSDIESVTNAFKGFAKQNYTMLDNLQLGYGGTKEEMQKLLADAEKLSGVKYDINSLSDISDAIQVIQEDMGIAGNAEAEANETVAGSIQQLQATYADWITDLGSKDANVKASTDKMVNAFGTAAKNVIPVVGQVLASLVQSAPSALAGMGEALSGIFDGVDLFQIATDMMNNAASAVAAFDIGGAASTFVQNLANAFTVDNVANVVQAGAELAGSIIKGVVDFVTNPSNWAAVGTAVLNTLGGVLKGVANAIFGGGGGGDGQAQPPEQHASGGVYTKPTLLGGGRHLVGEGSYSEAIIPLNRSVLATIGAGAAAAYAGAGSTTTTTTNIYINGAKVNNDTAISNKFYELMAEMARKGMM